MSVTPSSAIVGVFRDRATAEQALDALYNAGFTHEQVRYSDSETSGGFFDDLKSWFTGQNAGGNVANDLADLGLSDEEAHYYANEHSKGNVILAVKALGRGGEVQTILQQHGSLNVQPQTDSVHDTTQYTTYTSDATTEPIVTSSDIPSQAAQSVQPNLYNTETDTSYQSQTVPPEQETHDQEIQPITTNYNDNVEHIEQPTTIDNTSVEQASTQMFVVQDTPPITHDNVTEADDSQEAHPVVIDGSLPQNDLSTTSNHDEASTATPPSEAEQPQLQVDDPQVTTDHAPVEALATSDVMIDSQTISDTTPDEPQASQDSYSAESEAAHIPDIQTAQPVATITDYTSKPHETQFSDAQETASNAPTEPLTNSTTADEPVTTTTDQQLVTGTTDATTDNTTDELQSLQAQIASLQQQLQEARAQLQAAKEREEQVRTAREREQQLQSLRQQIQALQAELESTHSELQDTHSRIGQY